MYGFTINDEFYQFDFHMQVSESRGMTGRVLNRFNLTQIAVIAAIFLVGCEINTTPAPTSACAAKTAVIQVFDNGLKRGCGCTEAADAFFGPGQSLQCTVSAGTTVLFYYPRILTVHQIFIQQLITFSPRYPNDSTPIQVDGQIMNSSGTYNFGDTSTNVNGTIIVN